MTRGRGAIPAPFARPEEGVTQRISTRIAVILRSAPTQPFIPRADAGAPAEESGSATTRPVELDGTSAVGEHFASGANSYSAFKAAVTNWTLGQAQASSRYVQRHAQIRRLGANGERAHSWRARNLAG